MALPPGTLDTTVDHFLQHMHSSDRERFRLMLWSLQENQGGDLQTDFRLKRQDGTYLWYELRARAATSENTRLLRCVGLMRDVTSLKRSHERLMHDAVHDSLTGLPNRELFMDRLQGAITRAREGQANRPTVMFIDIDRFKNVNKSFGLAIGDSMLLTLARRLARHLNPQDTLARLGGDQFAILMISETDPRQVATLAERVRRALRTPMKIGGKEIVLTASIGIVVDDGVQGHGAGFARVKARSPCSGPSAAAPTASRSSAPRCGARTKAACRSKAISERRSSGARSPCSTSRSRALPRNQLAGFEALLRWDHPTRGRLGADDFVPIAEETGLIGELGSYVLSQALEQAVRWHKVLPRERDPLFVSVNVSSRQLFRQDLVQEIRLMLAREAVPEGHPQARDHRIPGHGESRARGGDPHLAQDLRRQPRARRFRHRLLLVELSAPLPLRHHQGRPLARPRQRAQRLDAADLAVDHRARA